ncbi:MAG TPA: Xaa-Pro peptidase family protein [Candidatus Dormibacteraeota bacterium]|nr:Xaa-Pro peptidase family protein [Candidatus Dormibacteraeota bacterium]
MDIEASKAREVLAANGPDEVSRRISLLRGSMAREGIDVFYVGLSTDLEYLAGIERPLHQYGRLRFWADWVIGGVVGPEGTPVLMLTRHLTKGHLNELGAPIRGLEVVVVNESDEPTEVVAATLRRIAGRDPRTIAINVDAPAALALNLRSIFPAATVSIDTQILATLRSVKSDAELAAMADACELVDRTYEHALGIVRPDMTEIELAREIDAHMISLGAVAPSFKTDIWTMGPSEKRTVGERARDQPIGTGTSLNFDFGAGLRGYCSDFGRTVFIGKPPTRYIEAYGLVVGAQAAGAAALRPGTSASEVDRQARAVIEAGGYGEWFWHRLGHSIGKDTHEPPFLDITDDTLLEEGMCFTIEPSIFIPGEFGCRVEDVYVVTREGGRRMNHVSAEMRTV